MNIPLRYKSQKKSFDGGGMSTASLFRDEHLDRDVIVKSLLLGADQKRLIDEVRALSTIRSKYVIEIYDVIRDNKGSIVAIVEEFVPGEDLKVKEGKVDAGEALHIIYQIAQGIADIHASGLIHRDIKPPNMKFDAEGGLKIFDFGLARDNDDAATKGLVGTFGYAAPELCVATGAEAKFTQAVDVFAFASTALKIVSGKIPAALKQIPPALPCPEADFHKQKVELPDEVCDVLNACHSLSVAARPKMAHVAELLAKYLLFEQHRASLVVGPEVHVLHAGNKSVNIGAGVLGKFNIIYDGLRFTMTSVTGSVYINNVPAVVPASLPGSCVITIGPPSAGMDRVYVPVDVSYPEVGQ